MDKIKKIYDACSIDEVENFGPYLLAEALKTNTTLLSMVPQLIMCYENNQQDELITILGNAYSEFRETKKRLYLMHIVYLEYYGVELNDSITINQFQQELERRVLVNFRPTNRSTRRAKLNSIKSELKKIFVQYNDEVLSKELSFEQQGISFLKNKKKTVQNTEQRKTINEQLKSLKAEHEFHTNLHLLQFYRKRKLFTLYVNLYDKIKMQGEFTNKRYEPSNIVFNTFFNKAWFLNHLRIEKDYQLYAAQQLDDGIGDLRLNKINFLQDIVNITDKLSILCNIIARRGLTRLTHFDKEVNAFFKVNKYYKKIPLIKVWYSIYTLLKRIKSKKKKAVKTYTKLENLLEENFDEVNVINSIEPKYLDEFFQYLINCSRHLFNGVKLDEERFRLYEKLFQLLNKRSIESPLETNDKNIIFLGGQPKLNPDMFKNIVTLMLSLYKAKSNANCKIKMTERKIDKFFEVNKIFMKDHLDTYYYCQAEYNFVKAFFGKASNKTVSLKTAGDFLLEIKKSDSVLERDKRRLELKLYYENETDELFKSRVAAFRTYLSENRDDIAKVHIKLNRLFISYINRVNTYRLDLKIDNSVRTAEKLLYELIDLLGEIKQFIVPDKSWLIQKIFEILDWHLNEYPSQINNYRLLLKKNSSTKNKLEILSELVGLKNEIMESNVLCKEWLTKQIVELQEKYS